MGEKKVNDKWCDQCKAYGHTKWLFLGTHRTHRLYIRFYAWRQFRLAMREFKKGNKK